MRKNTGEKSNISITKSTVTIIYILHIVKKEMFDGPYIQLQGLLFSFAGDLILNTFPLKCSLVSPLVVILGDDVLHLGLVLEHRLHVLLGLPHLLADKSVRNFFC